VPEALSSQAHSWIRKDSPKQLLGLISNFPEMRSALDYMTLLKFLGRWEEKNDEVRQDVTGVVNGYILLTLLPS